MQDIHSVGTGGGGGSRLFGVGGGGGVDRRLRSLNHQQALKCPRCESLNTKFCYYNNYNLSQPRHFCKACRRYWTRGGVLRNVPVGGGCRKAKRSAKSKPSSSSSVAVPPSHTSNSHSSSESSSLTAATTTAAGEVISNSSPRLFKFPSESHEFLNTNPMALIDQPMFPEMMTTSSTDLGFSTYRSENDGDMMNGGGYLNQTAEINEYSEAEKRLNNCGVEEWPDQGIFDLTQPYWTQTQWPDHSFHYLP